MTDAGSTDLAEVFTLDTTAPTLGTPVINGGLTQRSIINTIDLPFSKDVTLSLSRRCNCC